jgi:FtsX-like permease family
MGLTRWFRRRPSDDEMREELAAHVAMRAEHDRVDEAAARRRLGNMLHTRESMRRVWIAEWWDALRQDAHYDRPPLVSHDGTSWRCGRLLRQIAADLDPKQLVTIRTQEELLTQLTAQPRFIAWLQTAFAALALVLAAAGLYRVASYLVMQRRRDIGVRMAIGASPRDVARQVVGEAGRWIIGGALVGAALGWTGTRALQSQLYQVEALDPWSWTSAQLALVLVMAVFRLAYRAAHVDPVTALRSE